MYILNNISIYQQPTHYIILEQNKINKIQRSLRFKGGESVIGFSVMCLYLFVRL